jgi:hypothetical protein
VVAAETEGLLSVSEVEDVADAHPEVVLDGQHSAFGITAAGGEWLRGWGVDPEHPMAIYAFLAFYSKDIGCPLLDDTELDNIVTIAEEFHRQKAQRG